jgi:hypothetical protein
MKTLEAISIRTGQMWAGLIENGMMGPEKREGCHEMQYKKQSEGNRHSARMDLL